MNRESCLRALLGLSDAEGHTEVRKAEIRENVTRNKEPVSIPWRIITRSKEGAAG